MARGGRHTALLLVSLLGVTSCGGGDAGEGPDAEADATSVDGGATTDPSTTDGGQETSVATGAIEFGPQLLAAAEPLPLAQRLASDLGPEPAFAALLAALERGYDSDTVLAAAESGDLQLDGTVVADGQLVEPTGPPGGVVVLPAGFRRPVRQPAEIPPLYEQLRSVLGDTPSEERAGEFVLTSLIGLMRSGYSVEQLVELLLFGDSGVIVNPKLGCAYFTSPDGAGGTIEMSAGGTQPVSVPAGSGRPECLAQIERSDEPDEESADTATTPAPPATEPDAPAAPDDIGPLAWDGDLTLREGSSLVPVGEQWISISRTDGTNRFEGAMEVATMGDHEFAVEGQIDPIACTSVLTKRFAGSGTLDPAMPNRIILAGEQEVDVEYDCAVEVAETLDGTRPFEVFVAVTDTGLSGDFEGFGFDLPGVPVPIPG